MSYLLDTNVISEVRKASGNAGVRAWFASISSHELYLSVLVVGEIRQGIEGLARRDPPGTQGGTQGREYAPHGGQTGRLGEMFNWLYRGYCASRFVSGFGRPV